MIVQEININGYGKLKDVRFEFIDGINIIHSPNEGGKSTMHSFIENMFYHSYVPDRKSRSSDGSKDKYDPWGQSSYSGRMTILDGEQITVERDFSTKYTKVTIFDKNSKDITDTYESYSAYREPMFGIKHFGLSKIMFKNTLSVSQMNRMLTKDVDEEVKEYITNIQKTHDATISVDKVTSAITEAKNKIGRARLTKSNYAIREKRLKDLEDMKKESVEASKLLEELISKKEALNAKKNNLKKEIEGINTKLKEIEKKENNDLLEKVSEVDKLIKENEEKLEALKQYESFTYDNISKLKNLKVDIDKKEEELTRLENTIKDLNLEYKTKNDNLREYPDFQLLEKNKDKLKKDLIEYDHLEKQKDDLSRELSIIEQRRSDVAAINSPVKLTVAILLIGLVIAIITFFTTKAVVAIGVFLIAVIIASIYFLTVKGKYNHYIQRINKLNSESANYQNSIEKIEGLKQHKFDNLSRIEIESKLREAENKYHMAKITKSDIEKDKKEVALIEEKITKVNLAYEKNIRELETLTKTKEEMFEKFEIYSFDKLDELYANNKELEKLTIERQTLKTRRLDIKKDKDLKNLKKEELRMDVDTGSQRELLDQKDEFYNASLGISSDLSSLEERITKLKEVRSIQSIEEEMETLDFEKRSDDKKLRILDIVEKKIYLAVENVQNTVMPEVNKMLSEVVEMVTEGKYNDIKVNSSLGIVLYDSYNNKTVKLESLSLGTVDLLYIALRIGLASVINDNKKVPVFFDDAFVQIDETRLVGILKYLASLNRQIFIFTCGKREERIARDLNVTFNLINLG